LWQACSVDGVAIDIRESDPCAHSAPYTPLMTRFPSLRHGQLDDVDLLTLDVPGPLSAALIFRAGTATATFRTHPVPHLLEHLVLGALPRRRHQVNGTTTAEDLTFEVSGTPEQVRDTVHEICAAVRELPLERLAHEARVVDVEADGSGDSLLGAHAVLRCGLHGAGLEGVRAVPAAAITAQQVRDFAAQRLVRGNAVLVLTGPVPEGLHLDLPDGPRTVIASPHRADVHLPAMVRTEAPLTMLSLRTPDSPADALMARLARERAEARLRHELGISYSVDMERLVLGDGEVLRMIVADGAEASAQQIAEHLLGVLRDLAHTGPTEEERTGDLQDLDDALPDPRTHLDLLQFQAHQLLGGRPPLSGEAMLEEIRSITSEAIRESAQRALGTVLLTVPDEAEVEARAIRLTDRTDEEWARDPEVIGTVYGRRLLTTAPRDLRVVLGEDGLSIRVLGTATTFPGDQVVGIEKTDGWLELIRADGRSQSIAPASLRRGDELVRALEDRWGSLFYESAGV
jgi:hypothetical protein